MAIKNGVIIAGRYRVEKLISDEGGMAMVYQASLVSEPRYKVAIKFARNENGNGNGPVHEEKLLEREAELLRKWDFRHPGIVRIYPIPMEQDHKPVFSKRAIELPERNTFMVLEYLAGGSLSANLSKIKRYPIEWKLELFYQILLAVSSLHQKGYAHRDLKPDNIVFRTPVSENAVPQPVLIDFALAKNDDTFSPVLDESYSLAYGAPERFLHRMGINKEDYDSPSELCADVWSLGVILYEILTGEALMTGSEHKIRTSVIDGKFKDKVEQNIQTDLLKQFLKKMLDEKPAERLGIKEIIYAIEYLFPAPRVRGM